MAATPPVLAGPAQVALHARQEHGDRDAIPGAHSPTLRGARSDLLDDANRLVTGDEGEPGKQVARELLVIGSAQTARLDPQQSVVVTHCRACELPHRQAPRRFQNCGSDRRG